MIRRGPIGIAKRCAKAAIPTISAAAEKSDDGRVTALDVTARADFLCCGYSSGRIVLFDIMRGAAHMQKLAGVGQAGIDRHAATKAACSQLEKQARTAGRPLGMGGAKHYDARPEEERTWTVVHALLAMLAARPPQRHAKDVKS